jgi:hypothetical protein
VKHCRGPWVITETIGYSLSYLACINRACGPNSIANNMTLISVMGHCCEALKAAQHSTILVWFSAVHSYGPLAAGKRNDSVHGLQRSPQANAMREFELLGTGEDKPNPLLLERLKSCCQVIDALGLKVRLACSEGLGLWCDSATSWSDHVCHAADDLLDGAVQERDGRFCRAGAVFRARKVMPLQAHTRTRACACAPGFLTLVREEGTAGTARERFDRAGPDAQAASLRGC